MDQIATWMVAFALLSGDPTQPRDDLDKLRKAFPSLRQPMTTLALSMQILDPRECRFMLDKADEFDGDLVLLQRRERLLRAAPRLVDADRFPPRAEMNEPIVTNLTLQKQLAEKKPKDEGEATALRGQKADLDRRYRIWDAARDARCEYYYVTVRRQALMRLKDLIGEADFKAAKLPPAVPQPITTTRQLRAAPSGRSSPG